MSSKTAVVGISDRAFKMRSTKILNAYDDSVVSRGSNKLNNVREVTKTLENLIQKHFMGYPELAERFMEENSTQLAEITSKLITRALKSSSSTTPLIKVVESKKPRTRKPKAVKTIESRTTRKSPVTKSPELKDIVIDKPTPAGKAIKKVVTATKKEEPVCEKPTGLAVKHGNTDIVFSFDDTGSMAACRRVVRDMIDKISAELLVEFGEKLNVGVMIHGDYCDPCEPCVELPLGKDWVKIKRFLEESRRFGGGDAPECYELALRRAGKVFDWRHNANKILVLIGDEIPHDTNYYLNKDRINWRDELAKLADMDVKIISVQAMNNYYAEKFYSSLASTTGGKHLRLTQLNQIADLIRAICYTANGKLDEFESKASKTASYNSPAFRKNVDILAGRETTDSIKVEGLTDFQMFEVTGDIAIRPFVESMGLKFKTGCGYYEFMKPETVQDYKKVVVQDRETEVFYPDEDGRKLLSLPRSGSVRINPKSYDKKYRFFIQSTSYNRVLKPGTTFLYDVNSAK